MSMFQASARPTPTANDWKGSGPTIERSDGKMRGDRLDYATEQFWSTPRASGAEKGGSNQSFGAGGTPLPAQAQQWATPQARDYMPPHSPERIAVMKALGHGMRNLNDEATLWYTPNVPNGGRTLAEDTSPTGMTADGIKRQVGLENQASSSLPVLMTSPDGAPPSKERRSLNPRFVSWLMNWFVGYTELCSTDPASINYASLAMEWSRYRRRTLCALSRLGLPHEAPEAQLSFL